MVRTSPIDDRRRLAGGHGVRQASLTDVAELAGVSHMTVSRGIDGTGPVRPETRDRVQAAIQELDYRPNSAARTSTTGKSKPLGVVALGSTLHGPVPRGVHGVGFDDVPEVAHFSPPSTTVGQDFIEVGRPAVELLLAPLRKEKRGARQLTTPELIVRESTGPR